MRAVGAAVAVGVTTAGLPVTVVIFVCRMLVLALFPNITPTATFIENRLRLGHLSKLVALSLHCFCAYSATIVRWLCTWGVAPGYKLLRFQRA